MNKTCSALNTGSAFEHSWKWHSWKWLDKPEFPAPRKKQACACVQVIGRAEDKELVCGKTEEAPNYCFAISLEEKMNKEGVELSGTIRSLAFRSAAQLTPCLAAQLAGVKWNL